MPEASFHLGAVLAGSPIRLRSSFHLGAVLAGSPIRLRSSRLRLGAVTAAA